ncbi:MAG: leucine/isoleucine/valine transporter permease subunit [Chloroflexi bacterium]|nr:leucine/isoleucine/valine transporter permease subunit [Chloroflexota bacterium]
MQTQTPSPWKQATRYGLIGGAVAILMSLVGMVATFGQRYIVSGIFTMGQVMFLTPILIFAYMTIRRTAPQPINKVILLGALSGLSTSGVMAALVLTGQFLNLRAMFPNASPELYGILTFNQESALGLLLLLGTGLVIGGIAGGIYLLSPRMRSTLLQATTWVVLVGLLRDLIVTVSYRWGFLGNAVKALFAISGLTPLSAVILFILVGAVQYWRLERKQSAASRPTTNQKPYTRWLKLGGSALILILLPPVLGIFFSEILDNVGMYILMGLGLNIVVGFAGLLDLGYVAFFAIGAYTMGVLTSPELGFFSLTYWEALPFAMLACVLAGIFLGLPVLKMRGDYLAIVTLGFGEIVRLLALSDWLRPWLGGTQGIQRIAQPRIGDFLLNTQQELYYLFLIGIGIVAFIAWRLKDSRIGRAWMALREDEDVAMAMGINHVSTKLMAFAVGALFSGVAGTIFAAKLTSVYPHSMNFLVSINVLCLIIIGGMGSIPGVFVGSLVLIASPDLLREFAEFRYLAYGALLVAMMLTKPEGLWPEARRKLELHEDEFDSGQEPLMAMGNPDGR